MERVSTLIANALASQGYNVFFFNLIGNGEAKFPIHNDVNIYTLNLPPYSLRNSLFTVLFSLRKFVKKNKIEVLIDVDSVLTVFSTLSLWGLNVKHICWEHFNFNVNLGTKFRDLGRKWAAKYCDYVVTLTQRDQNLWLNGLSRVKAEIVTIPNPTPYENIDNIPNLESKTVLAVGRLTYQKGFDLLLEAWSLICAENKDWVLKIVGSGEDEDSLKRRAIDLQVAGSVEFIAATKSISNYYKSASIFCLSSRFEGFGMVLIEAQSFGLPIVAFDCECGPSDIVINDVNGILVENDSVKELSNSLNRILKSSVKEYSAFCENAKRNSKKYVLDEIINDWIEIL